MTCWFVLLAFMAATYMPKFAEAGVAPPPGPGGPPPGGRPPPRCAGVGHYCTCDADCCHTGVRCNLNANPNSAAGCHRYYGPNSDCVDFGDYHTTDPNVNGAAPPGKANGFRGYCTRSCVKHCCK
ncbi:unnamed protein product [Rotaria sordida]|uniref:Uncharacterized protein n=1 Tax=Rotaria sordida TaxID=392033 RepID=A0A819RYF0_9BILA|nr:unnamed protein product [Rotaria sordida]